MIKYIDDNRSIRTLAREVKNRDSGVIIGSLVWKSGEKSPILLKTALRIKNDNSSTYAYYTSSFPVIDITCGAVFDSAKLAISRLIEHLEKDEEMLAIFPKFTE